MLPPPSLFLIIISFYDFFLIIDEIQFKTNTIIIKDYEKRNLIKNSSTTDLIIVIIKNTNGPKIYIEQLIINLISGKLY